MGKGVILHNDGTYEVIHCEIYTTECGECPFYSGCKIPNKFNPSKR